MVPSVFNKSNHSREVAEMIGKKHIHLTRDMKGTFKSY